MLAIKNIVFFFIIITTFIAFISEVFVLRWYSIPDLILVVVFLFFIISGKIKFSKRVIVGSLPFFIVFGIILFYNADDSRSLTSGSGITGLFVVTFIYVCFLDHDKSPLQVYLLGRQISILYAIHIIYIFFETIVLQTHGYGFMKTMIPEYRNLQGQPIYQLLGLSPTGGANGLMVGAQVASQLLALSIIWFAPIYKIKLNSIKFFPRTSIWMLSLLIYPFCMTGTSLVMLLGMILIIVFLYQKNITKRGFVFIKILVAVVLAIGVFTGQLFDFLLYRLGSNVGEDLTSFYMVIFLDPVYAFIDLPLESKLFGMQNNNANLNYTDFGFAAIIWKGGLLLGIISIATFFVIITRALIIFKNRIKDECALSFAWLTLAVSNAVISIGWFLSLSHYTVATETGGKQLFAFSIAVIVLSLMRIDSIQLKNKKKPMLE